jgi:membrane protein
MEREERFYFDIWIALLSLLAGMVNVISLLLFFIPTTHFTGNITQFVLAFNEGDWATMVELLGLILCFLGGGILSGMLFSKKKFEPTKRYGLLLILFGSMMLLLFIFGLRDEKWLYFFSFVVGTQNGMFIFYHGIIVRTSHFTGYLTDIGVVLGRLIRGQKKDRWKVLFYFTSMVCFGIGGTISFLLYEKFGAATIIAVGIGYIIVGSYYFSFRKAFYV